MSIDVFFNEKFIELLAAGLGCPPTLRDVVANAFDVDQLVTLLERSGVREPDERVEVDALFWRLCSPKTAAKVFDFLGGPRDIWTLLIGLIDESAARRLSEFLTCREEEIFSAAAHVAQEVTEPSVDDSVRDDGTQRFDTLGVATLQALLQTIGDAYLGNAKDLAMGLQGDPTAPPTLRRLLPVLLFHGRRAYRQALRLLVTPSQTIGSLGFHVDRLTAAPYDGREHLRASVVHEGPEEHLVVEYRVTERDAWRPVLRFRGLDAAHREHLMGHLPRRGTDLHGSGETLIERILGSQIAAYQSAQANMWRSLVDERDNLVRYFVLSGRTIEDEHNIASTLPAPTHAGMVAAGSLRTVHPSPMAIYEQVVRRYSQERPQSR